MVESVSEESGYESWRQLHENCDPSTAIEVGQAAQMFTKMINHRAKGTSETRKLIADVEECARNNGGVVGSRT